MRQVPTDRIRKNENNDCKMSGIKFPSLEKEPSEIRGLFFVKGEFFRNSTYKQVNISADK